LTKINYRRRRTGFLGRQFHGDRQMTFRLSRRRLLTLALLAAPATALAHHGLMLWSDQVTTIEGFVSAEMDGFPHWEISVRTPDGKDWDVDVGSDFEMERAGMKAEDLPIGTKVKVEGNLPTDGPDAMLLRPLRVITGDKVYEFRGNWN
jgi:Family of unknown function (DUF6152)